MRRLLLLIATIITLCGCAFSQSTNASITGRITDPSKAVLPGTRVVAINTSTNLTYQVEADSTGNYTFASLPPGTYRLEVEKQGFKTIVKNDVTLHVQDVAAINFEMSLGSASESITVEGGAPLVNTQDAAVSTVVDQQFVTNMPLNGRSFQSLITLTPGVVLTPTSAAEQGQFSVNGQRADANYLTIDGVSGNISAGGGSNLRQAAAGNVPGFSSLGGTNSLVSVDAMQEFRIQTSTFAPEFGRTPGAQVSILTRSGTNQFHGTVFEYLRNDVLDAKDWFANQHGLPKAKERQNDFGGVLGGPLIKDKTFFFFSYEGLRLRQPQTESTVVPSIASRITATPGIQPYLNAYPIPNGSDLGNDLAQFNASFSVPSSLDAYSIRIDHIINSRVSLFSRYSYSPSQTSLRGPVAELNNTLNTDIRTHTLTVGSTFGLSNKVTDELRLNYSNLKTVSTFHLDDFGGAVSLPDSLLFPTGYSSANAVFGLYIFGAGGYDIGKNAVNEQRQLNLIDNFSVSEGNHQFKFGVDYRWLAPFTSPYTYLQSAYFLDMGEAVSGVPLETLVQSERPATLLVQNISLYAQDTWKATPHLNITYGLRWDVNPALRGKTSSSQLRTVQGLDDPATMTLAPAGTPLYHSNYGNVAPRVGISYAITQRTAWETVVRGGFGVFYDLGYGFLPSAANDFPFVGEKDLFFTPFPLSPQDAGPPPITGTTPVTGNFYVSTPNLKTPRTYQWNVALEQALGQNQVISATYVGAVGRNLLRQDTLAYPNPDFSFVFVTRNSATSDYHALQLKFQRRLARGLEALATYTWAHSLDVASNDSGAFNSPASVGTSVDRGNSDFDIRHAVTLAASYDVPSPGGMGFLHRAFGNWSLDTLLVARSATPVTVLGPPNLLGGTFFYARPDVVPGVPLYLYGSECLQLPPAGFGMPCPGGKGLNPNAFTNPPAGQQGDLRRNVLRGFGAWQEDFAIRRQFRITDKVALQFRVEFFNLFNHPNFGSPAASLSDPLFGRSTAILSQQLASPEGGFNGGLNPLYQFGGPRSGQVALKLEF